MENSRFQVETYTLKNQDCFAIFNALGNIDVESNPEEGFYYKGTRFLSKLTLLLSNYRPILLSASIKEDNTLFTSDLTNPDIYEDGELIIPKGTIHIFRSRFIYENCCYEKLIVRNYHLSPTSIELTLCFQSDFSDIFEVRGFKRTKKGKLFEPTVEKNRLIIGYEGLDGKKRKLEISFSKTPEILFRDCAKYRIKLYPRKDFQLFITFRFIIEKEDNSKLPYSKALYLLRKYYKEWENESCMIYTSNTLFNQWLKRSLSDLSLIHI